MNQPKPYIGITGFMTGGEVAAVNEMLPPENVGLGRFRFMSGILMSSKTLRGMTNKYPNKYPRRKHLAEVFSPYPETLNIIHYNTDDVETLPYQLMTMAGMYDGHGAAYNGGLHGFQLNVTWPATDLIKEFRDLTIVKGTLYHTILQVGHKALEQVGNSPTQLATRLTDYDGLVDYVLLDPSGGFGKPMDVSKMREFVQAIYDTQPSFGTGIAGGICPEVLRGEVGSLVSEFVYLSIDAEGRLRDEQDNLNLVKVRDYLDTALGLYTINLK